MTQVAVKLPDNLLAQVDDLVARGVFASRSSAIRHGLMAVVASQRDKALALAYERGYTESPESEGELAEATRLGVTAIGDEPWERWW